MCFSRKDFEHFFTTKKPTVLEVQERTTKFIDTALKKRHNILDSLPLKAVQKDIIEIHKECLNFMKSIPTAQEIFEKDKKELDLLTIKFIKDYTQLIQGSNEIQMQDPVSLPFNGLSIRDEDGDALINTTRSLLQQ